MQAGRRPVDTRPVQGQRLVSDGLELFVSRLHRQDRGPGSPCVPRPLEERGGCLLLGHDDDGLAAAGPFQSL